MFKTNERQGNMTDDKRDIYDYEATELESLRTIEDNFCTQTVCAGCGYRFVKGDDAVKVKQTGDVVHRECWVDYANDSIDTMTLDVTI